MKLRLAFLLLVACGDDGSSKVPDDWVELPSTCGSLGVFAPADFFQSRSSGEDSCVETYQFRSCGASLDWGSFSDRLTSYGEEREYTERNERINGWRALMISYRCQDLYCAAVNLPTDEDVSVTLFSQCDDPEDREVAMQIMRTLHVVR